MAGERKHGRLDIAIESGRRIRECRDAAGLTQTELAVKTGFLKNRDTQPKGALTPSRIGNYEQGTRRVGWEEAQTLARIFPAYPPAYFMGVITEREARVLAAMEMPQSTTPFTEPAAPADRRKNPGT